VPVRIDLGYPVERDEQGRDDSGHGWCSRCEAAEVWSVRGVVQPDNPP
jgi:hypothetical protein